jgi:hypothetical protein
MPSLLHKPPSLCLPWLCRDRINVIAISLNPMRQANVLSYLDGWV